MSVDGSYALYILARIVLLACPPMNAALLLFLICDITASLVPAPPAVSLGSFLQNLLPRITIQISATCQTDVGLNISPADIFIECNGDVIFRP